MNKSIKVYTNGQFTQSIYQKQNGTHTSWSQNDIIALKLVIIIVGGAVLSLLA
jgi:hypothetical protein